MTTPVKTRKEHHLTKQFTFKKQEDSKAEEFEMKGKRERSGSEIKKLKINLHV